MSDQNDLDFQTFQVYPDDEPEKTEAKPILERISKAIQTKTIPIPIKQAVAGVILFKKPPSETYCDVYSQPFFFYLSTYDRFFQFML